MAPEMEKKVLASLYDRLFDAITYVPVGDKTPSFNKQTSFLQFSKNEALNPADFANAATPMNPGGNLNTAEQFFRMVDVIPNVQTDYTPSANNLSTVYRNIVTGANSSVTTDPEQEKIYNEANAYLNQAQTIKDFTGKKTTQYGPSAIYAAYQNNQTAYISAVSGYRTAYLDYDLNKTDDQRKWQANEPLLQNAVNQGWNTWRGQGAAQVELALAALDTSINSAVRNALEAARQAIATQNKMASSLGVTDPWYMSYALPTNWYDESAAKNFTSLTLNSNNLEAKASSQFTSYGGGASWFNGLWSVGGSVSGSHRSSNFHMEADNFELRAKIGLVRIYRPWLHEFIFRMQSWWMDSTKKAGISNGQLAGNESNLIPLIPTAFIVARDIEISANFSSDERSQVEDAISAKLSVGYGPFSISGNFSHSSSKDYFQSTFDGGTLKVPGIQIIAWISEIVPNSPPENPPKSKWGLLKNSKSQKKALKLRVS